MTRGRRPRRGRQPLPDAERKARLVQTRVDEELDEALKQAARDNRTTVSQLIRNVLESTFRLVDDLVAGTASLTSTVRRDARRIAASAKGQAVTEAVIAWQEVLLARPASCVSCRRSLARGGKALMGLSEDPGAPRVWRCVSCTGAGGGPV